MLTKETKRFQWGNPLKIFGFRSVKETLFFSFPTQWENLLPNFGLNLNKGKRQALKDRFCFKNLLVSVREADPLLLIIYFTLTKSKQNSSQSVYLVN